MIQISLSEFADKLHEIISVIDKELVRKQENELYKGKITLPQFVILNFLYTKGESKMTDLARFMDVSAAAMTGIVGRLVRDGYVVRANDPEDRRIIKVKLTPRSNKLVRKINKEKRQMVINIFGRICEADRQDCLRIFMEIKDILTKQNPTIK